MLKFASSKIQMNPFKVTTDRLITPDHTEIDSNLSNFDARLFSQRQIRQTAQLGAMYRLRNDSVDT